MTETYLLTNESNQKFGPKDFSTKIKLIKQQLFSQGFVYVENIFSDDDAIHVVNWLGVIVKSPDADATGITDVSNMTTGQNTKNSAAFTNKELFLHTDRAPVAVPPRYLMNWMVTKNCTGGESLLVDGYELFKNLSLNYSEIANILTCPDIACFTDGIDTYTGPIFSKNEHGEIKIRFRYDQCAFFKIEASYAIEILLSEIKKITRMIDFNVGGGYIIDNTRWLHGRRGFNGDRSVKRILIREI